MGYTQELPISGNMYFIQSISNRDKKTGQYNPFLDGNINVTLNRIAKNIDNIDFAVISIPWHPDLIDEEILKMFQYFLIRTFKNKVAIQPVDFYGSNIGETRSNLLNDQEKHVEQLRQKILSFYESTNKRSLNIVCDFPILLAPDIINIASISYNYNWNKCTDSDSGILDKLFPLEVEISQRFNTYLYSDVQYKYWVSHCDKVGMQSNVFRSSNIFDEQYIKDVAELEIKDKEQYSDFNDEVEGIQSFIGLQRIRKKHIIFYPSRIEDPRYDFGEVLEYCKTFKHTLIFTNPTNIPKDQYEHLIPNINYLDLSNSKFKRASYFKILTKLLKPDDLIIHNETDMHISLIEQLILTKAHIAHLFPTKIIQSYTTCTTS